VWVCKFPFSQLGSGSLQPVNAKRVNKINIPENLFWNEEIIDIRTTLVAGSVFPLFFIVFEFILIANFLPFDRQFTK
jgi:hypothetical protein